MPIVLGTIVVVIFGFMPDSLMGVMQAAAVPMLTESDRRATDGPRHGEGQPRSAQGTSACSAPATLQNS